LHVPSSPTIRQREIRLDAAPVATCRALALRDACSVLLDGSGGFAESWQPGPLLAVAPTRCPEVPGSGADALRQLGERVARRRAEGGTGETGVAALLDYDLLDLVAFDVDRSIRYHEPGRAVLTERGDDREAGRENTEEAIRGLLFRSRER
jgi:hypothetical protein